MTKTTKEKIADAYPVDTKQLAPVKARITKAENYANELVIKTDDDQKKATVALSELNKIGDEVTRRKEEITKPLNAAIKSVRDLFKPLEVGHTEAVQAIKTKLAQYHDVKRKEEEEKQAKIAARVAKGTLKPETGAKKLAEVAPVEKNVKTDEGAVQYRKVSVATITKQVSELTDAEILQHAKAGHLEWSTGAVKKAALAIGKEGEVLPGVTVTVETQVANIR